jgi:protein-disulfide isomerase
MQQTNKLIVPIAIVIAGALIALGIYFSGQNNVGGNTKDKGVKNIVQDALGKPDAPEIDVAPVTAADHIKGSLDATVKVVEYSDTECPFCKTYHSTLTQIFNDYGSANKVAWVYRHFPLDMHTKAPKEAEATECAAEIGGTDMFWKYIDMIFANTPANNKLDPQELYNFADKLNLDARAFKNCLDSGKYATKINEAKASGFKAGARGTPYTVLMVTKNGKTETVPLVDSDGNGLGALQYPALKKVIEKLLN